MLKLNEEKMFYDIEDGQAVVINFQSGTYYGSSELGSEIIDRIINGCCPGQILKAIKALPGCPEDMDAKMDAFIKDLLEAEVLVEVDGDACGGDEPLDAALVAEGFDLPVEAFEEIQDLLLADPVHEVEPEMGWPVLKED